MAAVFRSAGRACNFLQFDNPASITAVSAKAVALAKENSGVVVAAGGDGTISAVAGAVLRSGCPFAVIPALQLSQVGIREAPPDGVNRTELTGVAVRPMGKLALFGLLARGVIGRLGGADNIDTFSFHHLKVAMRGKRRVKVATDGEILWMTPPLVFQVADTPLLLMVPAMADRAEVA